MPYRVQIQADFDWRIGYTSGQGVEQIGGGTATSLEDAQAQAAAVRTADRTKRSLGRAVIYDNTFPD